MKILLTGSTGQIGHEIIKLKPNDIEIISPDRNQLDLSNYKLCKEVVLKINPDWIINCGAYTAVDDAENDIRLSNQINANAPKAFTEIINEKNSNLLHISTDFVFDGKQSFPYEEKQKRNPLGQYGRSKALGEELIENNLNSIENATILRTSWVISPRGKNFILTMLKLHNEREEINVVSDQIGSPTSAHEIAKACWKIVELKKKDKLPFILHWSDAGVASWFDLAVAVGEIAKELKIIDKTAIVNPITTSDYPTPAQRPKYSVLNTFNTAKLLKRKPKYWRTSLKEILYEYKKTNHL